MFNINEKAKRNIFIVGGEKDYYNYVNWILPLGFKVTSWEKFADVIMFCGGEDVNPKYYNEPTGKYTYVNDKRDKSEIKVFNEWVYKKPFIGICRGSQFLGVMNRSKLIQHSYHKYLHNINTFDNKTVLVSSSHHQMLLLEEEYTRLKENIDYKLLGWAENLSPFHWNGKNKDYFLPKNYREVEIAYFFDTKSICIQSHPEMLYQYQYNHFDLEMKYFQDLFLDFIDNKLEERIKNPNYQNSQPPEKNLSSLYRSYLTETV